MSIDYAVICCKYRVTHINYRYTRIKIIKRTDHCVLKVVKFVLFFVEFRIEMLLLCWLICIHWFKGRQGYAYAHLKVVGSGLIKRVLHIPEVDFYLVAKTYISTIFFSDEIMKKPHYLRFIVANRYVTIS